MAQSQLVPLLLAVALLCSCGPRVQAASAESRVTATALAESVRELSIEAASAVRQATEELCAGGNAPDVVSRAMANATAKAVAKAYSSVKVSTKTVGDSSKACGQGSASATSAARATARAAAQALADAACCPSAFAIANATAAAVETKVDNATALAFAESCSEGDSSTDIVAEAVAQAVAEAVANAYAEAVASIEQCAGGSSPGEPSPFSPLPFPDDPSETPDSPSPPSPTPNPPPSPQPNQDPCSYVIEPRDTLSKLASKFDSTIDELMSLNPQIEDPNEIFAGDILILCKHDAGGDAPTGGDAPGEFDYDGEYDLMDWSGTPCDINEYDEEACAAFWDDLLKVMFLSEYGSVPTSGGYRRK